MKNYIETNKERFLEELFSLLRIPSVSSLEQHKPDMQKCAERLVELLMEAGADEAAVYPTKGHPVVFGQKMVDPSLPTVLVYGHYDVQPVDPIDLWKSDPFEPEIRDGAIYAARDGLPISSSPSRMNLTLCFSLPSRTRNSNALICMNS